MHPACCAAPLFSLSMTQRKSSELVARIFGDFASPSLSPPRTGCPSIALRLASGWSFVAINMNDSNTAKPLMDMFLHRFKRAKKPKVQDGGSHVSAGGTTLSPPTQPSTNPEARQMQNKQKVAESQEQVGSQAGGGVEEVPKENDSPFQAKDVDGSATISTPVTFQGLSLDLWNHAYEYLKTKDAHLVETWEIILSEQMTLEGMLHDFSFRS